MDLEDCKALLRHCEWADALVWRAVAAGAEEDPELRAKLYHMHLVQWAYLRIWRGEPPVPPELASFRDPGALRGWARQVHQELGAHLDGADPGLCETQVRFPWADRLVEKFGSAAPATWPESALQVALHSTYHRGQVARRLRELGIEPPLSDYIAWIWMRKPAADWQDAAPPGGSPPA